MTHPNESTTRKPVPKKSRLVVVAGSPGAGKSTYIKNKLVPLGHHIFDDFLADAVCDIGDMCHSRHHNELIAKLKNGENCVIADIKFSQKGHQQDIKSFVETHFEKEKFNIEIEWHCFEKSKVLCVKNAQYRNAEKLIRQIELINELDKGYTVPDKAVIIKTKDASTKN